MKKVDELTKNRREIDVKKKEGWWYLFWRGPEMTQRDAFRFYLWNAKPMTSEFEVSSRWRQCSLLYPTTGGNHP